MKYYDLQVSHKTNFLRVELMSSQILNFRVLWSTERKRIFNELLTSLKFLFWLSLREIFLPWWKWDAMRSHIQLRKNIVNFYAAYFQTKKKMSEKFHFFENEKTRLFSNKSEPSYSILKETEWGFLHILTRSVPEDHRVLLTVLRVNLIICGKKLMRKLFIVTSNIHFTIN